MKKTPEAFTLLRLYDPNEWRKKNRDKTFMINTDKEDRKGVEHLNTHRRYIV